MTEEQGGTSHQLRYDDAIATQNDPFEASGPGTEQTSPISSSPPEILRTIFHCLVEDAVYRPEDFRHHLQDLYALMLVCRRWNSIVQTHRILWFYIDIGGHDSLVDLCLERAGNHSLFLFANNAGLSGWYIPMLVTRHDRIRGIRIAGPDSEHEEACDITATEMDHYIRLLPFFPFPILDTLELAVPFNYREAALAKTSLPCDLFDERSPPTAPNLRSLHLSWFCGWVPDNFTTLTEFRWDSPYGLVAPLFSQFIAFLSNNLSLERITLIRVHFDLDMIDGATLSIQNLQSLIIESTDAKYIRPLLNRLCIPDRVEVRLVRMAEEMFDYILAPFASCAPSSPPYGIIIQIGSDSAGHQQELFWVRLYMFSQALTIGPRYHSIRPAVTHLGPCSSPGDHLRDFLERLRVEDLHPNVIKLAFEPEDGSKFDLSTAKCEEILRMFPRVEKHT